MKRISWDEFFMFKAITCATRHTCLKRAVGTVLVKENRIIGTGYNGAASGIKSCLELGYCYYEKLVEEEIRKNTKNKISVIKEMFKLYCQAVHAEMNGLSQCSRDEAKGATLYLTNYPCPTCTQDAIITNKIAGVKVWKEFLHNYALTMDEKRASERKLLEAGIAVNYVQMSDKRIKEITAYMIKNVGERLEYQYPYQIRGGKK